MRCVVVFNLPVVVYVLLSLLLLYHQIDESERCHLDIINTHIQNSRVLDVFWYGPVIASVELYRPEYIKPALKGDFVVFRFEMNNYEI